jgi:ArsR family transcriptional regulator
MRKSNQESDSTTALADRWTAQDEERARLLTVLAEPQRLRILRLLSRGDQCVCEIESRLAISQNLVSHHLKVLREAGLVVARKEGQFVHYTRNEDRIDEVAQSLKNLILR